MRRQIFCAAWPITDVDLTKSALVAQATLQLDQVAALADARLVGEPQWVIDPERNELVCLALAERDTPALPPVRQGYATPPQVVAEIRRLAEEGLSNTDIAYRLGVSRATVRFYRTH